SSCKASETLDAGQKRHFCSALSASRGVHEEGFTSGAVPWPGDVVKRLFGRGEAKVKTFYHVKNHKGVVFGKVHEVEHVRGVRGDDRKHDATVNLKVLPVAVGAEVAVVRVELLLECGGELFRVAVYLHHKE